MKPVIKNSSILITGASSSIANEIEKQLATDARQVILVARNAQKLADLASQFNIIKPALASSHQLLLLMYHPNRLCVW